MAGGLADDIHDAPVALRFHDGQYGFYHREKTEHFVAQLPFENIECRGFDGAAQMRAGIIDQNVDAAEFLMQRDRRMFSRLEHR